MPTDLFANLVAGLIAALLSAVLGYIAPWLLYGKRRIPARPKVSYQEKMKNLLADLARSSSEVDQVFQEMTEVSRQREETLASLETQLDELSKREKELQSRVDSLQNISLPAVQYFVETVQQGEQRSAKRDYLLFFSGVVVSTIIALALKLVAGI